MSTRITGLHRLSEAGTVARPCAAIGERSSRLMKPAHVEQRGDVARRRIFRIACDNNCQFASHLYDSRALRRRASFFRTYYLTQFPLVTVLRRITGAAGLARSDGARRDLFWKIRHGAGWLRRPPTLTVAAHTTPDCRQAERPCQGERRDRPSACLALVMRCISMGLGDCAAQNLSTASTTAAAISCRRSGEATRYSGAMRWRFAMASPIASLQGSLRAEKCFLTHSNKRPAPSLIPGHCSRISVWQASRTVAIFTSAVLHGSLNSSKCALVHSASRFPSDLAALQNPATSRLQSSMALTY